MPLTPGTKLGHYEVVESVGAGGMGEVYKAKDLRLDRDVAIKVLPQEMASNAERLRRFEQEARAASALNHPHIVHIYDIGEHQGTPYIAMEYVKGRTLREVLEEGPLKTEELLRYARQIAEGLAKAHAAGIVHRDLKPSNAMISDDGYIKILDFGLAKFQASPGEIASAAATVAKEGTMPGTILGTVGYMSPEQAKGEPVDFRADQFAFGALLYELATGEPSFIRGSVAETLVAILQQTPRPPLELNPAIPRTLCSVIDRCLNKAPHERYETTELLLSALRSVDESPALQTTTPPERHTVGRDEGLRALQEALESTSKCGSLMTVAGEPGIGKTTLVETFLDGVRGASASVVVGRGRCSERLAGTEAYLPILESLESLSRNAASFAPVMERVAPAWYGQLRGAEGGAASQERLKRELGALLEELARERRVVLFFEDLHWADASTVDVLGYLGARFDRIKILVVVTYRLDELMQSKHPFLELKLDLMAKGLCREVPLPFLGVDHIAEYLELEFPTHEFPSHFSEILHRKTEGSPLFIVDLLRYLKARGVIAKRENVWRLRESLAEIEGQLPASVRGMIDRKLARLSDRDRQLLLAASVQGEEFDSAVASDAAGADPAEVEDRLEALEQDYALVRLVEERELPDRTLSLRYRFVHVLYQNALYGTLKPTRRAALSRKVAKSLERHHGEVSGSLAAELAYLYETARDFERAAHYFALAAQNAGRLFANQEAVALARRGLEAVAGLPESSRRTQTEMNLQLGLGWSLGHLKGYGYAEVEVAFEAARALAERTKEQGVPVLRILAGLWVYYIQRGHLRRSLPLAEACLERTATDGRLESDAQAVAHGLMGVNLFWLGNLRRAREHLERGLELWHPNLEPAALVDLDPVMFFLMDLVLTLWLMGECDLAWARMKELRERVRVLSDPMSTIHGKTWDGLFCQFRRDAVSGEEVAREAQQLCETHESGQWLGVADFLHGWSNAEQGRGSSALDRGIQEMQRGLEELRSAGADIFLPYFRGVLAEVLTSSGYVDEAKQHLHQAVDEAPPGDDGFYRPELHRIQGELLLAMDPTDTEPAEASYERAASVAREQGAKMFELRAVMSLSRLLQKQGRGKEASGRLREVYAGFTEGLDAPDLEEAKLLLGELS